MKTFLLLVCLLLGAWARPVRAAEILRPDQLHSGMKGYGLSVFKGTQPERFEVEILGVLKNAMPKQDMILIRLSGANLERHKVIAGMSGSPIYIDGKLIGALAYGWGFENEPLAGVTPIANMLAELHQPRLAPPPVPVLSSPRLHSPFDARATLLRAPGSQQADSDTSPRPLLTPLSLGGFSPRLREFIGEQFAALGLLPTAGAAGGGDEARAPGRMVPGGAIGVELIRGDLNAVAVGTATYVEGNRILAFGHPFFQAGHIEAPAVQAEVHTIMSSVERSFKMASSAGEIGALIGDWQSCIVADTQVNARMIPVSVTVRHPAAAHSQQYALEVIDNEVFTPRLLMMAIAEPISTASGSSQDTTLNVTLTAELGDRTVQITDKFFNSAGGMFNPAMLAPLLSMFSSPFGQPRIKRVSMTVDAVLARQTAEIRRAYFSKAELERGETVPLTVVLKPYGQPEITRTIPIVVPPSTETMREVTVIVMAGNSAPPDIAPPENLSDYLNAVQQAHRSTDLVALVQTPGQGLQYRGQLLKNLPASVRGVLEDATSRDIINAADVLQLVAPTDWVLTGQTLVRAPIRQE